MGASIGSLIAPLRPFCRDLLNVAAAAGLQPRLTSTRRSHAEQGRLYRRFLAGQQPFPVAPPGTSAHEFGFAFDMVTATMNLSDFQDLGDVWKGWGGIWGGAFNDPIHFEYPGFKKAPVQAPEASGLAEAADLILGFTPGIGEVELGAELLHLGFRHSEVLKFLKGPIGYIETHYQTDPGVFAHLLRWVLQ